MRFGELRGLSSLPIPRLREQFRYEDVLTVLPVQDAATARETLLVATRSKLALLTPLPWLTGQWMTRWAAWDAVTVVDTPARADREDAYRLDIRVGGQLFRARLIGETGRKALRDFIVAFRLSRPTHPVPAPPSI
jgi:hypothetical protein